MRAPFRPLSLLTMAGIAALPAAPLICRAQQTDINWSSSFLATNLDSDGAPLDNSFSFFLGVFNPQDPSWTPQSTNTAEWADYWITADVAHYDSVVNSRFASGYNLEPLVEGINLTGKKGYIWGVNRTTPGEWILISGATWTWPADEGIAFPRSWTVNTGTAVLGTINESGVHMQTARVTNGLPPLLRPGMWRRLHFTQHERDNQETTVSGWMADPNRDGHTNLEHYALGTNPRTPDGDALRASGRIAGHGTDFLTLRVSHDPNCDALITAEVSTDLETWLGGPADIVIERPAPSLLVLRDTTPIGSGHLRRFLRLRVSLP